MVDKQKKIQCWEDECVCVEGSKVILTPYSLEIEQ